MYLQRGLYSEKVLGCEKSLVMSASLNMQRKVEKALNFANHLVFSVWKLNSYVHRLIWFSENVFLVCAHNCVSIEFADEKTQSYFSSENVFSAFHMLHVRNEAFSCNHTVLKNNVLASLVSNAFLEKVLGIVFYASGWNLQGILIWATR